MSICITFGCNKLCRESPFNGKRYLHCWDHMIKECKSPKCGILAEDSDACEGHKCKSCHRLGNNPDNMCDFHTAYRCKVCGLEAKENSLCDSCTCKTKECKSVKFIYVKDGVKRMLKYCIRHRCKYATDIDCCDSMCLDGSLYCGKHTCPVGPCSSPKSMSSEKCFFHQAHTHL